MTEAPSHVVDFQPGRLVVTVTVPAPSSVRICAAMLAATRAMLFGYDKPRDEKGRPS